MAPEPTHPLWHGTTILSVRKGGQVIVAGDGQVSMGQTVVKSNARKVRRLGGGSASSPGSPARPPTRSRCSSGSKPSSNNIPAS